MGFWGPFTAVTETLRPTVANADEQEWIEAQQLNRNPMPIDPLNQNQFVDPNEYGLQTVKNDQTFQPDPGMTLQEMLAQRDLQSAAYPTLSQAKSPLSFQYQDEEYPNRYGKSELYYGREGPFSDKRQVADPNAYYEHVRSLGTEGDPFLGARDDVDAPFAKQSGDYYDDYVNYDETTDRPYQGNWSWQQGYTDDLTGMQESDPMLMEALINSKNAFTPQDKQPQDTVNVNQIKNLIANAKRKNAPFSNFYGDQEKIQRLDERGNPLPTSQTQSKWEKFTDTLGSAMDNPLGRTVKSLGRTAKKAGKIPMGILAALANTRNPLNPNSKNFNPMLAGQMEAYGDQGWEINDMGQALTGPLAGQNIVSGFGTNDVAAMLRKRLQRIRTRKIAQTDSSRKKQADILNAIKAQTAAENAGYTGTPGGNVGSGAFAKFDQSGKTYGPYSGQGGNQGSNKKSSGGVKTGAGRNPWGRRDGGRVRFANGGLASLFTRRG